MNPPSLACAFTQFTNAVAGSTETTVSVSVANTGDVKAFAPSVTLMLPSGYSIVSGSNPQTLSDIASQGTGTATWTIRSPSSPSGVRSISVDAASTCYGETFTAATLTRDQTVDVDPPSATVVIAGDAAYTNVPDVTVALSATDAYTGVAQMRVRNAGAAWGAWTSYATSVDTTLSSGDGTKTFEAQFQDGVGNVSSTIDDSIVYDTTPPAGKVLIAADADFANSSSVTLTSIASDASSGVEAARFSNDGVSWGGWNEYASSAAWTLVGGEGTRTVYAQYRDGAGNVSNTVSDTIVIETGPPTGSVVVAGGAAWTTVRGVALTLSATDEVSGVRDMRFSDDGSAWSAWQSYGTSSAWTLASGDGAKTVFAQFRDGAGNVSETGSDGIGLDGSPPTGTLTIAGDASFTSTSTVTLDVSASDALNGVSQMRFSNDASNWSAWMAYATTADWTVAPGEGPRNVFAQFQDGLGNVSGSTWDTIHVDSIAPGGTLAIEGGSPAINSVAVALDLAWADGGSGVTEARMSNDGTTWSAWTPVKASLPWTIEPVEGAHTVFAQFRDAAGNVSATSSDSILFDSTAPTGAFVLVRDAAYVLPWETLTADTTASDGPAGSGVAAFRSSDDGGATWSDWASIPADGRAIVPRPAAGRDTLVTIEGEFRDVAGNVSAVASDTAYLVDGTAPSVTKISSFTGTAGVGGDIDAVRIGLVAGDRLTLKLKLKTLVKKADAYIEIDVYGPGHEPLVTGRHPAASRKPGVAKFPAPETGEYWIVLRSAGTDSDTGVGYTLKVGAAPAKGSRALKGTASVDGGAQPPAATILFDAVDGLNLTGTLIVPDTAAVPTLVAPDGSTVPLTRQPGKKGSLRVFAPELLGGAGTYALTIPATAPVTYSLALAPTKRGKLDELSLSGD